MGTALDWIGQIASWIGQWIPRWRVVPPTEAAVKAEGFFLPRQLRVRFRGFDGDMRLTACGPGLHWFWPATTMMDSYPTKFQSDNLPSQTFETLEGMTITVGGVVSYTVHDIVAAIAGTHSAMKTIQVHTLAAIHEVCCKMTLDELKSEQRRGTLKTKLRNQAQGPLSEFGVKIEDCRLTDLAKSRALRLIQSTQVDDN